MPRPTKSRLICSMPRNNSFGPRNCNSKDIINMTVEEYESIRLIDYEKLTQEESSKFMGVARTTIQRMYDIAREKLADCLINGKMLTIEGGNYRVCSNMNSGRHCNRRNCKRLNYKNKKDVTAIEKE